MVSFRGGSARTVQNFICCDTFATRRALVGTMWVSVAPDAVPIGRGPAHVAGLCSGGTAALSVPAIFGLSSERIRVSYGAISLTNKRLCRPLSSLRYHAAPIEALLLALCENACACRCGFTYARSCNPVRASKRPNLAWTRLAPSAWTANWL